MNYRSRWRNQSNRQISQIFMHKIDIHTTYALGRTGQIGINEAGDGKINFEDRIIRNSQW